MTGPAAPLLSVRGLSVDYIGETSDFRAVDDVSFDISRGEIFGLAGESGCGKSTIAYAITRVLRPPGWRPAAVFSSTASIC